MTAFMPEHRTDRPVCPAHESNPPGTFIRALALALLLAFSSIAVAGAQDSTPDATPSAGPTPAPTMPRLELNLEELNDSGIDGTVTLYDAGDQTIVEFDVEGAGGDHPAHIHAGVCGELDPEPAYPLENVDENGESITVVDVTLDDLLAEDYAIDMHLAPNELGTLIACVNIDGEPELPADVTPEASPEATPTEEAVAATPTETQAPTEVSDGTGGADSTETPVATEAVTTVEPTPTETEPAPTEAPAPATEAPTPAPTPAPTEAPSTPAPLPSGQGDISDGTGGAGATVPLPTEPTTTTAPTTPPVGGDGTAGVSGKGEPVSATTLPQQAGVGSALIWPDSPAMAMTLASGVAAVVLGSSAWIIRRGERSTMTSSSRWTRMGI